MSGWTLVPDDASQDEDVNMNDVSSGVISDVGSDSSIDEIDRFPSETFYHEKLYHLAKTAAEAVRGQVNYKVSVEPEVSGNDTVVKIECSGLMPSGNPKPEDQDQTLTEHGTKHEEIESLDSDDRWIKPKDLLRRQRWTAGLGASGWTVQNGVMEEKKEEEEVIFPPKSSDEVKPLKSSGLCQGEKDRNGGLTEKDVSSKGLQNYVKQKGKDVAASTEKKTGISRDILEEVKRRIKLEEMADAGVRLPVLTGGHMGVQNGTVRKSDNVKEIYSPQCSDCIDKKPVAVIERTTYPFTQRKLEAAVYGRQNDVRKPKSKGALPNKDIAKTKENGVSHNMGKKEEHVPHQLEKTSLSGASLSENGQNGVRNRERTEIFLDTPSSDISDKEDATIKLGDKVSHDPPVEKTKSPKEFESKNNGKRKRKVHFRARQPLTDSSSSDDSDSERSLPKKRAKIKQEIDEDSLEMVFSNQEHKDLVEELAEQVNVSFTDKAISDDEKEKILSAVTILVKNKMMKNKNEKKQRLNDQKKAAEEKQESSSMETETSDVPSKEIEPKMKQPMESSPNTTSQKSVTSARSITVVSPSTKYSVIAKTIQSGGKSEKVREEPEEKTPIDTVSVKKEVEEPSDVPSIPVSKSSASQCKSTTGESKGKKEKVPLEKPASPVVKEEEEEGEDDKTPEGKRRPYCKRRANGSEPQCMECGVTFKHRSGLSRHRRIVHLNMIYKCPHCNFQFTRSDSLKLHLSRLDSEKPDMKEGKTGPKGYTLYKRTKGQTQPKCEPVHVGHNQGTDKRSLKKGKGETEDSASVSEDGQDEVEEESELEEEDNVKEVKIKTKCGPCPGEKKTKAVSNKKKVEKMNGGRGEMKENKDKVGAKVVQKNRGKKSVKNIKTFKKSELRLLDIKPNTKHNRTTLNKTKAKNGNGKNKKTAATFAKKEKIKTEPERAKPTKPRTSPIRTGKVKLESEIVKSPKSEKKTNGQKLDPDVPSSCKVVSSSKIDAEQLKNLLATQGNAKPGAKRFVGPPELIHIKTTDGRVITVCKVKAVKDKK